MKYNVYAVFGLVRQLIAITDDPLIADELVDRFKRFPLCDDITVEKFDDDKEID